MSAPTPNLIRLAEQESEYARWVAAAALEERRARLAPFLAWLPEPTTHGKKGALMTKPGFRTVRCLP